MRLPIYILVVFLLLVPGAYAETKKVNKREVAIELMKVRIALTPLLYKVWLDLPEDPNGPEIDFDQFHAAGVELFDDELMTRVKMLVDGDWPEIDPEDVLEPEEPEEPGEPAQPPELTNVVRIKDHGGKMSWNSVWYQKFVFPKKGPEYTSKPFTIKYSDGNTLYVPDPKRMTMRPDNTKYQPGGEYSNNNPDIPTMEVYAPKGSHIEWVEAHFLHPVDPGDTTAPPPDPEPTQPPESDWERIVWADKCRGTEGNRDRYCWTKIHGGSESRWWRKFALPDWMDDKEMCYDFRFSDGTTMRVSDTKKRAPTMYPDGPKYLRQVTNEPKKDHPKISEKYGANAEWVEYRKCR